MDENYDEDPLGLLAEFKKGRYMSFSIDSSNLYLNEIPEGDYSDGKNPTPGWPSIQPPPPPARSTWDLFISLTMSNYLRSIYNFIICINAYLKVENGFME